MLAIAGLGSRKKKLTMCFKIKDDPPFSSMANTDGCQKWSHNSPFSCLEKIKSVSLKLMDETYSFSNYRLFSTNVLMENCIKKKRTISRNQLASFLSVIGNIIYINVLLLYLYVKSSIKTWIINNNIVD